MKKLLAFVTVCILVMLCLSTAFAHTHVWGEWAWEIEPTCQKTGRQVRSCTLSGCGSHDRRTVQKADHDYLPATCEQPKTCKYKCGTTTGSALGHSYAAATCVSPKKCVRCAKTEGDLGAHRYSTATCTKLATCYVCGLTKGTYKDHTYVNGKCSVCGASK